MLQDLIDASYEQDIKLERRLQIPVTEYTEVLLSGKYIGLERLLNIQRIPVENWYTVGVVQIVENNSFELSDMKGLSIKCINNFESVIEGDVVAIENPNWRRNLMLKSKGSVHFIGKSNANRCRQCRCLTADVLCSAHLRESIQKHKSDRQNIKTTSSVFQFDKKKEFKKPEILDKSTDQFFEYIAAKNDRVSNMIKKQTKKHIPKNFTNPLLKDTAFYKKKKEDAARAAKDSDSDELEIDFNE